MKSNKTCDFISRFKFLILIPVVLVFLSIIIGVIFGFNLDYDFKDLNSFSVKFNTTVTDDEYDILKSDLNSTLSKFGISNYRIDKIGEGAKNGLLVKVIDKNVDFEKLKTEIEETYAKFVDDKIESNVVIRMTDVSKEKPNYYSNVIWFSLLAIACIMLFMFIYNFIRYNLASAISGLSSMFISILTLLSLVILCRIPVNPYSMISVFVMIFMSIITTTLINNYIRNTLNLENYEKVSNSARVYESISKLFKNQIISYSLVLFAIILIMFFGNLSLVYVSLSCLLGIVIAFLTSFIYNTSIWALCYKKDKDIILKKRLQNEKLKAEGKTDDKIIV